MSAITMSKIRVGATIIFAPLLLVWVLVSCANVPAPQTPKQALVVAEYTYQGALNTVLDLANVGTITKADVPEVTAYIDRAEAAMRAARSAVLTGSADAPSLLVVAQKLTGELIAFLEAKKGAAP